MVFQYFSIILAYYTNGMQIDIYVSRSWEERLMAKFSSPTFTGDVYDIFNIYFRDANLVVLVTDCTIYF